MTDTFAYAEVKRRGLMLILSAPSGCGKTTTTRRILADDPNIDLSVSYTTRAPRPGEVEGKHYHFIDMTEFELMVNRDLFLEYNKVFGNYYGTPRLPVINSLENGRDILFDIDWQGTRQIAQRARNDVVSIFLLPPSWHELERRLFSRDQDTPVVINRRMAQAPEEMSHWQEYDYVVINRDINVTVRAVHEILNSERQKRVRQVGLKDYIDTLLEGN